jgi:uncharacterized membrane protein
VGERFIYFGILHAIAVSSLLAWPLVRRPLLAGAIGTGLVIASVALAHPAFDQRALSWLGFATHKPQTEDYVPLAPWLGVVLIGVWLGYVLMQRNFRLLAPLARAPAWIRSAGRHSLLIYMVHQPILVGSLWFATIAFAPAGIRN